MSSPSYSPSALASSPQPRGWFSRNWKWFVPLVVLTPILLFTLFIGGIVAFVFGVMTANEPYKHAVEVVTHDPQALQALGAPVKIGRMVSGNIHSTDSSGEADLSIPVSGSAHKGRVYVIASKYDGIWHYEKLQLWLDGESNGIDLLHRTTISPQER